MEGGEEEEREMEGGEVKTSGGRERRDARELME